MLEKTCYMCINTHIQEKRKEKEIDLLMKNQENNLNILHEQFDHQHYS